jgi:hypothetical protein
LRMGSVVFGGCDAKRTRRSQGQAGHYNCV